MDQVHERVNRCCFSTVLWLSDWKPSVGGYALRSKGGCTGSAQRASEDREKNYTPQMCRQEHMSKVPDLYVFMTSYVSLTSYIFDFHKYRDASWCGVNCSLSQFQVLAMQRQPISRPDKDHEGHFLSRAVAQARIFGTAVSYLGCQESRHRT